MSKKIEQIARFDIQKLEKAVKLDNGFLRAPVLATRTGVFRYVRSDGTILREYRPESEVFSEDSMSTLAGVPLTNRHPAKLVDSNNARKFTVGHVSDIVERDGKFIKTSVVVADQKVIDEIENKGLREVSCGYKADLEFTPGITEDGEEYDAIQRNIRYNHLAVVDKGRAGPQVRLRLDSNAAVMESDMEYYNPKPSEREDAMAKVKLNGAEFEVDAGVASAINSALEKAKKDGKQAALDQMKEKKDADDSELQAKIDEQQAQLDSLKEENEKLKADSLDEAQIQERVEARAALMEVAKPLLKKDADVSKMTDLEIKKAVIVEQTALDAEDKKLDSDTYVDARFDAVVEAAPKAKKNDTKEDDNNLRKFLYTKKVNEDSDDDKIMDSDEVRRNNMNHDADLWMKPIAGAATKPTLGGDA